MNPDRRHTRQPEAGGLTAAAAIVRPDVPPALRPTVADWQAKAWDAYDTIGEYRFGVQWFANVMSKVRLIAAEPPAAQGDAPTPLKDGPAVELLNGFAGGLLGQAQIQADVAVQMIVPGSGYLVIEQVKDEQLFYVLSDDTLHSDGDTWFLTEGPTGRRDLPSSTVVVRIWRPHPRYHWQADSPTHPLLGVLNEIRLLSEHIEATALSRLSGAGILVIPSEAEFPKLAPDATDDELMDMLIEYASTAIEDRKDPAAVVPIVVRIPAALANAIHRVDLWTAFDEKVLDLRENGLRRLALGLDVPPEIVMGTSDLNHWAAWAVSEQAITIHVEPQAQAFVTAVTEGYLRPALRALGEDDAPLVWYDTYELRTRPDRSQDAINVYDRIELSGSSLRRETGFSEEDRPEDDERLRRLAEKIAIAVPLLAPQLLDDLGLPDALDGQTPLGPTGGQDRTPVVPRPPVNALPAPPDQRPDQPGPAVAASVGVLMAGLMEASDAMVTRALERAGLRARNAAGRKQNGGASAVHCEDGVPIHVCLRDATNYLSLDTMLEGAWDRLPEIADRLGLDLDPLRTTLDAYTRSLIAAGVAHDYDRLDAVLLSGARPALSMA